MEIYIDKDLNMLMIKNLKRDMPGTPVTKLEDNW